MERFAPLKKLLLRGTAFVLPVALLWCAVVFTSNETLTYTAVIDKQIADTSIIYGPAYSMDNRTYRSAFAAAVQPETLIVGDSRISPVRGWFFEESAKTYNACWGAITPAEVLAFLQSQPEGTVKTVFYALNHADFNPNYKTVEAVDPADYRNPARNRPMGFAGASSGILNDWKAGRLTLPGVLFSGGEKLGVSAKYYDAGVLTDGSFFSVTDNQGREKAAAKNPEGHLRGTVKLVEQGAGLFVYGEQVGEGALEHTEKLLAYCRGQGITLIGILPPFASPVNAAIAEHGEHYGYLAQLPGLLAPLFAQYGQEFHNYLDITHLGCDGSWFADGHHPGDPAWLRIMVDMIERGSALGALCDAKKLRIFDENRHNNYLLLGTLEEYQARLPQYPNHTG
ncbi:hypothetical protein LJC64_02150 [Ruminococcaceae bacterium OttesenSCG-928-A11]|nr:hypothetical protein [Ruminococcaceae bacterium OttesenSCG-928-A11]